MMFDIAKSDMDWIEGAGEVAMATVIQTWRSSPRPIGSRLFIRRDGNFIGSVSGGCVEAAVVREALAILEGDSKVKIVEFGVSNDSAWQVGLPCGGQIAIHIQALKSGQQINILKNLSENIEHRKVSILASELERGKIDLVEYEAGAWLSDFGKKFKHHFNAIKENGQSALVEIEGKEYFLDLHLPKKRLIIVGAVHIAEYLSQMALMLNFEVIIIEPREFFRREERFANAKIISGWPDEAVRGLVPDKETALVALSHDPKFDLPALQEILLSDAFYVGALGSRKSHAKRVEALRGEAVSEHQIARIHGPVGLDIGSVSPQEIALSIVAHLVEKIRHAQ